MNASLLRLLSWTPGIIRTRRGVTREQINLLDWTKVLIMKDPATVVKVGGWVRAQRGTYKGDISLVAWLDDGIVEVLMVPRLKGPKTDSASGLKPSSSSKRRRSAILPAPMLFDPTSFKHLHDIDPKQQGEGRYIVGGFTFEHGLIRKRYDLHSLLSDVTDISSYFLNLFVLSQHPIILASTFPHPREWIFEDGEWVTIQSSNKLGSVNAVFPEYLEVELASNEGAVRVTWGDIRKVVTVGDFVRIGAGPLHGTTGWVDRIDGDTVHIIEKCVEGEVLGSVAHEAMRVRPSQIW